jgi:hypothetical protein
MQIYRVTNKAKSGQWVVAMSAAHAAVISLSAGHARKVENLRITAQTIRFSDFDLSKLVPGVMCICHEGDQSWLQINKKGAEPTKVFQKIVDAE